MFSGVCVYVCLFPRGCHNKIPQPRWWWRGVGGWLTQWKFIFLPFWRPEVRGVGGFCFFRVLSPWLADGRFVPVSSHGLSSVWEHPWCLSVCPNSLFLQGHRQSDQISAHSNSLILTNYLFKLNSSQPSPDLTSLQPGRGHVGKMRGLMRQVHPEIPSRRPAPRPSHLYSRSLERYRELGLQLMNLGRTRSAHNTLVSLKRNVSLAAYPVSLSSK